MRAIVHEAVDADRWVLRGQGEYWGAVLVASNAGAATVDIYDGDSAAGELIASLGAPADGRALDRPPAPIHVEHGIYVDLGSNVSKFTLFYLDGSSPVPAQGNL